MKRKLSFSGSLLLIICITIGSSPEITFALTNGTHQTNKFLDSVSLPICGTPFAIHKSSDRSRMFANYVDSLPAPENSFYAKYRDKLEPVVAHYDELGFDITMLLKDPRFKIYEGIDDRFEGAAEKTSFSLAEYKEILGFEYKVNKVDEFIEQHIKILNKAEEKYGISKFIIAAILGIESNFGNNIGSHDPFNVYISMIVVDYRADFARAQLKHLLMFTERENIDVHNLKSSYAGAMSYAQFIPYSVNKWWVGDELFNMKNNILSVANYLAYFKERTDDKVTMIMRYNPSSLYANAVLDLAEAAEKNYTAAARN